MALTATRTAAAQTAADRQVVVQRLFGHAFQNKKGGVVTPPFQQPSIKGYSCVAPDPHTYMHANRNSQTTSTKCQYQAANSKPRCCFGVKCPAIARTRQTIRKIEPIITCAPWNPVAMKKVAP